MGVKELSRNSLATSLPHFSSFYPMRQLGPKIVETRPVTHVPWAWKEGNGGGDASLPRSRIQLELLRTINGPFLLRPGVDGIRP